eukprot:gnl/MRDRNA2_/MRDRNA2_96257_c0_seq1.p1 gnl/MRDRNA2_/MRDRNA2_96257_c0~~gnl/MRDRNA2_/MRDRNA2_96257_c0_seq1.p1  ORF type:complete len:475 (+),score=102.83 gnl/MRDRNA2_/MRDRNA2_96257_c0_seq1:103-1527(+)
MPSLSNHIGMHAAGSLHKADYLASQGKAAGPVGPTNPALWWAQSIVPMALVLITCAPAWWPMLCEKVRSLRSFLSIENLRRVFQEHWPEIIGLTLVGVAAFLGLLLGSGGHLASDEELDNLRVESQHVVELRRLWPWLLHPDSLMIMQQLLRGLGALLLVYRCGAGTGGGAFAPAFMQMAAASGMRLLLWSTTDDYQPEGPLAGKFAIACTAITFVAQLLATYQAMQAAASTSWRSKKILGLQYVIQVLLCLWAAYMNHYTVGHTDAANIIFSAIDAADMSAAPIFAIAACVAASENAPSVAGAMHVMAVGQILGLQWYLDFAGVGVSANNPDPFIQVLTIFKSKLQRSVYGEPLSLLTASHIIQLLGMLVSCFAAWGFNVGFFKNDGPKAAPKEVIEKLELVQWDNEMFADDSNACCAICLGDFEDGDQLRRLPCGHQQFHAACVDHWLSKAGRCPLCVADITPEDTHNKKEA